ARSSMSEAYQIEGIAAIGGTRLTRPTCPTSSPSTIRQDGACNCGRRANEPLGSNLRRASTEATPTERSSTSMLQNIDDFLIEGSGRPESVLADVRTKVAMRGAAILRGFDIDSEASFKEFCSPLATLKPYWISERLSFTQDDLIQGVDPGAHSIFPHAEMA